MLKRYLNWVVVLVLLVAYSIGLSQKSGITISPLQVGYNETVTVSFPWDNTSGDTQVELFEPIQGENNDKEIRIRLSGVAYEKSKVFFKVPDGQTSGGPKLVRITKKGEKPLEGKLVILGGDVVPNEVMLVLKSGVNENELQRALDNAIDKLKLPKGSFAQKESSFRQLGGQEGSEICGGAVGLINVNGIPLGQAIELLRTELQSIIWTADPDPGWNPCFADQSGFAVANQEALVRGGGKGITIAVLDTGVLPDPELGSRLNMAIGKNVINSSNPPVDTSNHGTPVAVLAAGSGAGVAGGAEIMPVKVCERNPDPKKAPICLAYHVVLGLCWALNEQFVKLDKLVVNLSLGGPTPVDAIESILQYGLKRGVPIAAAAGNDHTQGNPNSQPPHYPASYSDPDLLNIGQPQPDPLPGMLVVGNLEKKDNNRLNRYKNSHTGHHLDVAEYGTFVFGSSLNGTSLNRTSLNGTSFSTPQIAGWLAVLRERCPAFLPTQLEAKLKNRATQIGIDPTYTGVLLDWEIGKGKQDLMKILDCSP